MRNLPICSALHAQTHTHRASPQQECVQLHRARSVLPNVSAIAKSLEFSPEVMALANRIVENMTHAGSCPSMRRTFASRRTPRLDHHHGRAWVGWSTPLLTLNVSGSVGYVRGSSTWDTSPVQSPTSLRFGDCPRAFSKRFPASFCYACQGRAAVFCMYSGIYVCALIYHPSHVYLHRPSGTVTFEP